MPKISKSSSFLEYSKWGLFDSTLLCCFGWTEENESPCQPQPVDAEMYRTVVVTEPSREYDPSEYDEAELEFMCQVHFFFAKKK